MVTLHLDTKFLLCGERCFIFDGKIVKIKDLWCYRRHSWSSRQTSWSNITAVFQWMSYLPSYCAYIWFWLWGNFANFQQIGNFCYILDGQCWNFEKFQLLLHFKSTTAKFLEKLIVLRLKWTHLLDPPLDQLCGWYCYEYYLWMDLNFVKFSWNSTW